MTFFVRLLLTNVFVKQDREILKQSQNYTELNLKEFQNPDL